MFNLLSFCSAWHGLYIYVYNFPVSWINIPKNWTECCSPSSFLVETLGSPKTMLSIKFPEVWISMTANTFCLCVLWKACITWHFWTHTENWHFHEKSPYRVPYLPLTTKNTLTSLLIWVYEQFAHESLISCLNAHNGIFDQALFTDLSLINPLNSHKVIIYIWIEPNNVLIVIPLLLQIYLSQLSG